VSGLFASTENRITPLTDEEVEGYFDYAATYRTAKRSLRSLGGTVELANFFEDPHLLVMINDKEERANVIPFGTDTLLCYVIWGGDEDRLYFLVEATDDLSDEGDDAVLIRTWRTRPNTLFGSDIGDQHIMTVAARANLALRLVELNPDV
jgi:hypothetical protein